MVLYSCFCLFVRLFDCFEFHKLEIAFIIRVKSLNGRTHTRDGLSVWAGRVIHWIIRITQIIRQWYILIWEWNGLSFGWKIRLTLSIYFSVNFDGFWRWIIRLRRIFRLLCEKDQCEFNVNIIICKGVSISPLKFKVYREFDLNCLCLGCSSVFIPIREKCFNSSQETSINNQRKSRSCMSWSKVLQQVRFLSFHFLFSFLCNLPFIHWF